MTKFAQPTKWPWSRYLLLVLLLITLSAVIAAMIIENELHLCLGHGRNKSSKPSDRGPQCS